MIVRIVLMSIVTLILTGCGASRTPLPETRRYTLEYENAAISGPVAKAVISLSRFGAAPPFNTTNIVYRDMAFGRQEYAYHQWRTTPQTMVMDYLRRDLQRSGLFLAVSSSGTGLSPTHQLEGMVEEWMEVDEANAWRASAELSITLVDLHARSVPDMVVFQRSYRASEPCAKKNPGSVVEAMSRAMRSISERIITDVYAAVRQ